MLPESKTYYSQLYRNFRAIEPTEYRRIVRFFEKYEKSIQQLDFEEYFDAVFVYTNALFEVGEYRKHVFMSDVVIETSIKENITHLNGNEVFRYTLFKKAAAYFNLNEFDKTIHILSELLKMNPSDTLVARFLERTYRVWRPQIIRVTRAIAVLFFLLSAVVICVEVLIVKSFYESILSFFSLTRNVLFCAGLFVLVSGEGVHRLWSKNKVRKMLKFT